MVVLNKCCFYCHSSGRHRKGETAAALVRELDALACGIDCHGQRLDSIARIGGRRQGHSRAGSGALVAGRRTAVPAFLHRHGVAGRAAVGAAGPLGGQLQILRDRLAEIVGRSAAVPSVEAVAASGGVSGGGNGLAVLHLNGRRIRAAVAVEAHGVGVPLAVDLQGQQAYHFPVLHGGAGDDAVDGFPASLRVINMVCVRGCQLAFIQRNGRASRGGMGSVGSRQHVVAVPVLYIVFNRIGQLDFALLPVPCGGEGDVIGDRCIEGILFAVQIPPGKLQLAVGMGGIGGGNSFFARIDLLGGGRLTVIGVKRHGKGTLRVQHHRDRGVRGHFAVHQPQIRVLANPAVPAPLPHNGAVRLAGQPVRASLRSAVAAHKVRRVGDGKGMDILPVHLRRFAIAVRSAEPVIGRAMRVLRVHVLNPQHHSGHIRHNIGGHTPPLGGEGDILPPDRGVEIVERIVLRIPAKEPLSRAGGVWGLFDRDGFSGIALRVIPFLGVSAVSVLECHLAHNNSAVQMIGLHRAVMGVSRILPLVAVVAAVLVTQIRPSVNQPQIVRHGFVMGNEAFLQLTDDRLNCFPIAFLVRIVALAQGHLIQRDKHLAKGHIAIGIVGHALHVFRAGGQGSVIIVNRLGVDIHRNLFVSPLGRQGNVVIEGGAEIVGRIVLRIPAKEPFATVRWIFRGPDSSGVLREILLGRSAVFVLERHLDHIHFAVQMISQNLTVCVAVLTLVTRVPVVLSYQTCPLPDVIQIALHTGVMGYEPFGAQFIDDRFKFIAALFISPAIFRLQGRLGGQLAQRDPLVKLAAVIHQLGIDIHRDIPGLLAALCGLRFFRINPCG